MQADFYGGLVDVNPALRACEARVGAGEQRRFHEEQADEKVGWRAVYSVS